MRFKSTPRSRRCCDHCIEFYIVAAAGVAFQSAGIVVVAAADVTDGVVVVAAGVVVI